MKSGTAVGFSKPTQEQREHILNRHLQIKVEDSKDGAVSIAYVISCEEPQCPMLDYKTVAMAFCPKPPCPRL
ncbi:MAG TPA: hypothetical protein VLY23_07025 [Candidatus Acidoferrum sp.]|nr:hypothetical protein [Candidatus Acidoferrum sp.]